MSRVFSLVGGVVFVVSLVFFTIKFLGPFGDVRPWSWGAAWLPILVNIVLFTVFAIHHSIFARTGFKARVSRRLTGALERSFYVWISSLLFLGLCAFWRPVPGVVWQTPEPVASVMLAVQVAAAVLAVVSAGRIDVLQLAGVRQAFSRDQAAPQGIDERGPYSLVRHPIYLGWCVFVWLTPVMNGTRLVFALTSCIYLLLAVPYEERDLRQTFGITYDRYAERVRWKFLPFVY